MGKFSICVFPLLFLFVTSAAAAAALPLSTDSRWIVGLTGRRVKLACIVWPSHLDAAVAEGLSKRPMDAIAEKILSMGFNCVRFTWPLYLATDDSFASMTVRQSLRRLGLFEAISGVQANNPSIIDLPLIRAFQEMVSCLGKNRLMVILDNYTSQPGWCCSDNDGNGFFWDRHFNPDLWINSLKKMASMFANVSNVVGMSLRNDLRGPRQNTDDWYKYMQKGAEAVHSMNPNVLVIVSGLSYETDLSFLRDKSLNLTFTRKLVFEIHWYGFWNSWETENLNQICARLTENMMNMSGFLLEKGIPLFVSEFGVDQRGNNRNDNRFLNCFMAVAAELDLDWALWTLAGSYYTREKAIGADEYFGVLDWSWIGIRNSTFFQRISAIQRPFRGPGLMETYPHKVIFHPSTGLCVVRESWPNPFRLKLGPCNESDSWRHTPHRILSVKEQLLCIKVDERGQPAKLRIFFSEASCSKWKVTSESKMQLASLTWSGASVCLDVDSDSNIVTTSCKCLHGNEPCDPGSQWFKLVTSTRRRRTKAKPLLWVNPYSKTLFPNLFQSARDQGSNLDFKTTGKKILSL
ncbi:PREDICTED: uncharacterized protein LOC104805267 [Tarenaya hassleriana]|uniref:uncharacterized protein LOC104805267 n=1 Tax=Tarenaya hassleriana TaxID=28532 RepID=UPI00053C536F|nr:PREDICTED: uncharacterized protein LOC104805267 [Tarenaya hassleriana]